MTKPLPPAASRKAASKRHATRKKVRPICDFVPDAKPIVKWVGGKSNLVPMLVTLLPDLGKVHAYHEPFAGGLALYLAIHKTLREQSIRSHVWDVNARLLDVYRLIREDHLVVLKGVEALQDRSYADLVGIVNKNSGEMAVDYRVAAFLLVNRRCFNGVWRENKLGLFNVPKGTSADRSVELDELETFANAMRGVVIGKYGDRDAFDASTGDLASRSGEFHYFDPPYDGTYSSYGADGFDRIQHLRLATFAREIHRAGGLFMVSTSDTPFIRGIYDGFNVTELDARRSVAASGKTAKSVRELAIRNYSGIREWTDNSKVTP